MADKNVLGDGQIRKADRLLMNERDAKPPRDLWGRERDGGGADEDLPPIRQKRTGQDLHERALARALFSNERVNLAGAQVNGYIVQRDSTGKRLADISGGDEGRVVHSAGMFQSGVLPSPGRCTGRGGNDRSISSASSVPL